jgi:hypothetical protein
VFNAYCTMIRWILLRVLAFSLAMAPQRVVACSCEVRPVRDWYAQAQVVFVGELVSATPHPSDPCGNERLTFIASEVFKGGKPGPIILEHGSVGRHKDGSLPSDKEAVCFAPCAAQIKEKDKFIVFAFTQEGHLRFVDCAPNFWMASPEGRKNLNKMRALAKSMPR